MLPREAAPAGRAARHAARALTARLVTTFVAAGLLAAAAGCGGDDGEPGDAPEPTPSADRTELTVTLHPEGPDGRPPETAEVSCPADPPGEAACEAVDVLPADPAAPVPPEAVCTQIYGGPDLVQLEGTLRGEEVDAELTRVNGCAIDRFDRFLPLLRALFRGYRPGEALRP